MSVPSRPCFDPEMDKIYEPEVRPLKEVHFNSYNNHIGHGTAYRLKRDCAGKVLFGTKRSKEKKFTHAAFNARDIRAYFESCIELLDQVIAEEGDK